MTASHRLQTLETEVSGFSRAVAAKRATVAAVVGFALAYAASRGWITPAMSDQARSYVADGLTFLTAVGAGVYITPAVTPARQDLQPRNSAGQLLIPDPDSLPDDGTLPPTVNLNGSLDQQAAVLGISASTASTLARQYYPVPMTVSGGGGGATVQPDPFMEGGGAAPDASASEPPVTP